MSAKVERMIAAQRSFDSCKDEVRAAVAAKIKRDYHGYNLPDSASIEIRDGMVYVCWQDLDAINYGFDIDEDDYVDLYLSDI